jgi:hypothetical protein
MWNVDQGINIAKKDWTWTNIHMAEKMLRHGWSVHIPMRDKAEESSIDVNITAGFRE